MNKFDCEIIKDLLPLYADNVCSEKSTKCVEEHLQECAECSEELRKIKECPAVPTVDEDLSVLSECIEAFFILRNAEGMYMGMLIKDFFKKPKRLI